MTGLYILSGALVLDILLSEAPNHFHPVAWLGKLISFLLRFVPGRGNAGQFIYGLVVVILTLAIITVPVYYLLTYFQDLSPIIYVIFSAYLLKNCFSLRGLWQAVDKVKLSLSSSNLGRARRHANALVSRNVANLTQAQLMSAAIESCAENLCDSFVAPLLYFAVFGLPGAVAYRIVNTFDAMIGFHGKWEYTGKFAAHLDDILNFIPARLSAILIIIASAICKASAGNGWQTMLKQHSMTESPNAGWTMSAMAGSLGIILDKAGAYTLGSNKNELTLVAIGQSQAILMMAASIWGIIVIAKEVLVNVAG